MKGAEPKGTNSQKTCTGCQQRRPHFSPSKLQLMKKQQTNLQPRPSLSLSCLFAQQQYKQISRRYAPAAPGAKVPGRTFDPPTKLPAAHSTPAPDGVAGLPSRGACIHQSCRGPSADGSPPAALAGPTSASPATQRDHSALRPAFYGDGNSCPDAITGGWWAAALAMRCRPSAISSSLVISAACW